MLKKMVVIGAVLAISTLVASCATSPRPMAPNPNAMVCMHNTAAPADDTYLGMPDTLNNLRNDTSTDGSCTGISPTRPYVTAVWASDSVDAATKCAAIPGAPTDYVYNFKANSWAHAPAPLWLCGSNAWSTGG
jgi:hypothetical protein